MDLGLDGKVAIVTAATANIGRAVALDLAAEGARLVTVGRYITAGERLVAQALALGAEQAVFVAADLLDPAAPERICAAAGALGPVAVLVNGVGGNVDQGCFVDADPAKWAGDIDLNFGTILRMTQPVLRGRVERREGAIVNIGSTAGLVGDYMLPVYSAMKAAVHGFTRVLAREVGQHGVRVNAVAPTPPLPPIRPRSAASAASTRNTASSRSKARRSATRTRRCASAARSSAARSPRRRRYPASSPGWHPTVRAS